MPFHTGYEEYSNGWYGATALQDAFDSLGQFLMYSFSDYNRYGNNNGYGSANNGYGSANNGYGGVNNYGYRYPAQTNSGSYPYGGTYQRPAYTPGTYQNNGYPSYRYGYGRNQGIRPEQFSTRNGLIFTQIENYHIFTQIENDTLNFYLFM